MSISGIYKITIQNYFYYGSATNLQQRKKAHLYLLKNNRHFNNKMQNVYNKHGGVLFEVVEFVDKKKLLITEQEFLTKNFNNSNCLNLNEVTSGGIIYQRTPEIIAKQLLTKKITGKYGGANENSWKAAILANTGAKRSALSKLLMSKSKKEFYKNNPQVLITNQIKGRQIRWEKQCKPFILKGINGNVYGPFKKQKDCYLTGIINSVSLNKLYNKKINECKGLIIQFKED